MLALNISGIPSKDKNGTGDNDAEEFREDMEEEIIIQTDAVEP